MSRSKADDPPLARPKNAGGPPLPESIDPGETQLTLMPFALRNHGIEHGPRDYHRSQQVDFQHQPPRLFFRVEKQRSIDPLVAEFVRRPSRDVGENVDATKSAVLRTTTVSTCSWTFLWSPTNRSFWTGGPSGNKIERPEVVMRIARICQWGECMGCRPPAFRPEVDTVSTEARL
jgi:hypothetical protein